VSASQAEGRGSESRLPLQKKIKDLAHTVKSFFHALVVVASVFASVWQKKYSEKLCVIPNIFETLILQKGRTVLTTPERIHLLYTHKSSDQQVERVARFASHFLSLVSVVSVFASVLRKKLIKTVV
jgi:hypothetical protein